MQTYTHNSQNNQRQPGFQLHKQVTLLRWGSSFNVTIFVTSILCALCTQKETMILFLNGCHVSLLPRKTVAISGNDVDLL